jgi:hypothetical protein
MPVVVTVAVASGLVAYALRPRATAPPRIEPEATSQDGPPAGSTDRPEATTGKLVIHVRTADGRGVPAGTMAGWVRYGARRMRPPAPDGSFPFADAPVGRLVATAEAPGYSADSVPVEVTAGVDAAEPIVTLTPIE